MRQFIQVGLAQVDCKCVSQVKYVEIIILYMNVVILTALLKI